MNRLTRQEMCNYIGCGMTKLYELERSGQLEGTYYQIGRKRLYIKEKVEKWLMNGGETPRTDENIDPINRIAR